MVKSKVEGLGEWKPCERLVSMGCVSGCGSEYPMVVDGDGVVAGCSDLLEYI